HRDRLKVHVKLAATATGEVDLLVRRDGPRQGLFHARGSLHRGGADKLNVHGLRGGSWRRGHDDHALSHRRLNGPRAGRHLPGQSLHFDSDRAREATEAVDVYVPRRAGAGADHGFVWVAANREVRANEVQLDVVDPAIAALAVQVADTQDMIAVTRRRENEGGFLPMGRVVARHYHARRSHDFQDAMQRRVEHRAEAAGLELDPQRLPFLSGKDEMIQVAILADAAVDPGGHGHARRRLGSVVGFLL